MREYVKCLQYDGSRQVKHMYVKNADIFVLNGFPGHYFP
jgi:hypothetical protein